MISGLTLCTPSCRSGRQSESTKDSANGGVCNSSARVLHVQNTTKVRVLWTHDTLVLHALLTRKSIVSMPPLVQLTEYLTGEKEDRCE